MMTVHEFGVIIQENKHLYSEEEYLKLCNIWRKEYEQYLLDLIKNKKDQFSAKVQQCKGGAVCNAKSSKNH